MFLPAEFCVSFFTNSLSSLTTEHNGKGLANYSMLMLNEMRLSDRQFYLDVFHAVTKQGTEEIAVLGNDLHAHGCHLSFRKLPLYTAFGLLKVIPPWSSLTLK